MSINDIEYLASVYNAQEQDNNEFAEIFWREIAYLEGFFGTDDLDEICYKLSNY